jgi:hypothetical protein
MVGYAARQPNPHGLVEQRNQLADDNVDAGAERSTDREPAIARSTRD